MSRGRNDGPLPKGLIIGAMAVVAIVALLGVAKLFADRTAAADVDARADELTGILKGSTPEDFLAFNSGRSVPGSIAKKVADQSDFVSVNARADRAVIRLQPKGWWAGFTERCVVGVVRADRIVVETPKTACVRTDPSDF